jgi:hypothetical protein
VDAAKYSQSRHLLLASLDYIHAHNVAVLAGPAGTSASAGQVEVPVYNGVAPVPYPRDAAGNVCAMVHPDRQGRDFEELHEGDALFLTMGPMDADTMGAKDCGGQCGQHPDTVDPSTGGRVVRFRKADYKLPAELRVFPYFVNEAAYMVGSGGAGMAMVLARRRMETYPVHRVAQRPPQQSEELASRL